MYTIELRRGKTVLGRQPGTFTQAQVQDFVRKNRSYQPTGAKVGKVGKSGNKSIWAIEGKI